MHLIGFLIMGAIVGWLAGKIMSGHGYGIIWDIVLGVVGSFLGGLIFSLIFGTQPTGLVISFIVALIGAVVLVAIVHMVLVRRCDWSRRPEVVMPPGLFLS